MTIRMLLPVRSQAGYLFGPGRRRSAGRRQSQKHRHRP